jgi:diaminopimelate decarboxylase
MLGLHFTLAYSLKANSFDATVRFLSTKVSYADVVSIGEIEKALKNGFAPERLLYIGPVKTERDISEAIRLGVNIFIAESIDEIATISRVANSIIRVIVRVNPKLQLSKSGIIMTGGASQFGVEEDNILDIIRQSIALPNINITGIHMYIGTQILKAETIVNNFKYFSGLIEKIENQLGITFSMVGFGGGYGHPYFSGQEELDNVRLMEGIDEVFRSRPCLHDKIIISESGRFMVASSGYYIMKVLRIKESAGKKFVITDGGAHHHSAASGIGGFIRRSYPISVWGKDGNDHKHSYEIVGRLCTSTDTFGTYTKMPEILPGDILIIPNSGAYCYAISPLQFLSFTLPEQIMI